MKLGITVNNPSEIIVLENGEFIKVHHKFKNYTLELLLPPMSILLFDA
jgi:archaellum component FlaF (FlaF/FlaG flagellin family)